MTRLLHALHLAVYILLALTAGRGLILAQAGDLVFAGLMAPLMLAISWRLRAEGLLTHRRFDERPF